MNDHLISQYRIAVNQPIGKETELPQRLIDIDEGIRTSDFGILEDIIKDTQNISPCVHATKNEAAKGKDEVEHPHILTSSFVPNLFNVLLR